MHYISPNSAVNDLTNSSKKKVILIHLPLATDTEVNSCFSIY